MDFNEFKYNERVMEIFKQLKRMFTARGFEIDDNSIYDEIYQAALKVNSVRRFKPTSDNLFESQYEGLIKELCIISVSKWGAEGESSHSENGVSRSYIEIKELLSSIIPLGKARK